MNSTGDSAEGSALGRGCNRFARDHGLSWFAIGRLGLVQAALGAVVVLTTSTLNRVMVVELALPALVPGLLVALHYLVQVLRPAMGHGGDVGGRRTPWIVGGMAVLAIGGVLAALATVRLADDHVTGLMLAVAAYALIGIGVSACGTSLLVLLAQRVAAPRRAGAAAVVWLMMIAGFAVTAGLAGAALDPYTPARLVSVSSAVSGIAFVLTLLAVAGLESRRTPEAAAHRHEAAAAAPSFRAALADAWADPAARRFTIFVFVSMLAYSAQDLILEPYAGAVFGFTPGASTRLSGVQHGGVLAGMLIATLAGKQIAGRSFGSLKAWGVGGCLASALALAGLALGGLVVGPAWPLRATVFVLGASNGAFSIAAIGSMMRLAGARSLGTPSAAQAPRQGSRAGVRMGLWGGAQAIAFGLGGLVGTAASDLAHWLVGTPSAAYASVFVFEALLFVIAALLAARVEGDAAAPQSQPARQRVGNALAGAGSGG